MPACNGINCGCTDGLNHSPECQAEHVALATNTAPKPAEVQFQLAGANYRIDDFTRAKIGKGDTLTLVLEPTNVYDRNAVKVLKGDIHIGYVPRSYTALIHEIIRQKAVPSLVVESAWSRGCTIGVSAELANVQTPFSTV